ncbi:MAG: SDR family oxidoreductase [Clostridiaceae bacterium]|nr:SDR family oxidoreductase [Clostridiaceae bacterium]
MKGYYGNVVLITGASSGIGKACAEYMARLGYRVYGTSRRAPESSPEALENGMTMVRMDVCSDGSVKAAIDSIIRREGEIGIVINNAGMGIAGAVEDTSPQEAFLQMDTNFFGVHRVIRQVLPHMRKKGRGLIINMSSVGALFPIPYQSMYVAAKAAVEGMTGSLRNELRPFGIKAAYVEPGDTKTGFTGSRIMTKESGEGSAYYRYCKKSVAVMERDEINGPDPITVARAVARLAERKNPPVCVTVGLQYKILVFLKRLVPKALESFVLSKMYKG